MQGRNAIYCSVSKEMSSVTYRYFNYFNVVALDEDFSSDTFIEKKKIYIFHHVLFDGMLLEIFSTTCLRLSSVTVYSGRLKSAVTFAA